MEDLTQEFMARLLERVVGLLQKEYAAAGRGVLFESLKPFVWAGAGPVPWAQIAAAQAAATYPKAIAEAIQSAHERGWRWCKRKPALAGAMGGSVLLLLLASAGVTWQWFRADDVGAATVWDIEIL